MKKKDLPVSRKLYADITSRLSSVLAASPASLSEAMRMLEVYLCGGVPESDDMLATVAFGMVRIELDRGMERSRRARERSAKKRAAQAAQAAQKEAEPVAEVRRVTVRDENPAEYDRVVSEGLMVFDEVVKRFEAKGKDVPFSLDSFLSSYIHSGREYAIRIHGIEPDIEKVKDYFKSSKSK